MPEQPPQKHRTNRVFKSLHKPLTYPFAAFVHRLSIHWFRFVFAMLQSLLSRCIGSAPSSSRCASFRDPLTDGFGVNLTAAG